MKFRQWIKALIINTINKNKRFVIPIIYLALVSLFLIHTSIYSSFNNEQYLIASLFIGMIFSLLMILSFEKKNKNNSIIITLASILVTVIIYLYLPLLSSDSYVYLAYFGIVVAILSLILFVLYKLDDNEKIFAYLFSKLIYCWIISLTLLVGLFICVAAFDYLILNIQDVYKIYLSIGIVCEVFINGCLFLSYIPNGESLTISKPYENVVHKVAFTLYYILVVILYGYLLKVVITFNMPVGKINWFASFALLFYCFFYLSGLYLDKGIGMFHKKYGGLVLLPIFLMQSIAIYIRVNAYGLTFWRITSIIFNIIALSFIISSFIKVNRRWVFVFISLIILLVSISHFNLIDIPIYQQEYLAKKVLIKNNMYVDDKIISNSEISSEDKEVIRQAYLYVRYSESNKANLFKDISYDSFESTFGFSLDSNETNNKEKYDYCYYYREDENYDIAQYSQLTLIEVYDSDEKGINDYCRKLYKTYGKEFPLDLYYITENGDCLIFESLSFTYDKDNDKITNIYYYGLLLRK